MQEPQHALEKLRPQRQSVPRLLRRIFQRALSARVRRSRVASASSLRALRGEGWLLVTDEARLRMARFVVVERLQRWSLLALHRASLVCASAAARAAVDCGLASEWRLLLLLHFPTSAATDQRTDSRDEQRDAQERGVPTSRGGVCSLLWPLLSSLCAADSRWTRSGQHDKARLRERAEEREARGKRRRDEGWQARRMHTSFA